MAKNLQKYTLTSTYINGNRIVQDGTVSITRMGNGQRVETLASGFAGLSPGSPMMEFSVSGPVPAEGFDFDPGQYIEEYIPVEITFFTAGKTLTQNVFIERDSFSQSTGAVATIEFSGVGPFAQFE